MISYAKINLFLYITGIDNRGYHKLQSLFCIVPNLYDTIALNVHDQTIINCNINIQNNIILKAINLSKQHFKINLHKNIPIGAGLGGGSSNAATVLLKLHSHNIIDDYTLLNHNIGEDVNFFLSKYKIAYYDNNQFYPVKLNTTLYIIIVVPDFANCTKDIYEVARINNKQWCNIIQNHDGILYHIFYGQNHLYEFAKQVNSKIAIILTTLYNQYGILFARMTGSGSSCFGAFNTEYNARIAMQNIQSKHDKWFVHYCILQDEK